MLHQAAGWCFQLEEAPQPAKVINGNTTCKHALLLPQGVEAAIARAQAAALASSPAPSETAAPAALAGADKPPTPSPVRRQQEAAAAALASPEQRGVSLGNAFARAPPRVMSTPDASEVQPITGQIQPVQRLPQSTAAAAAVAAAGAAPEGEPQSRQQSVAGRLSRFGTRSEQGGGGQVRQRCSGCWQWRRAGAAGAAGAQPAGPLPQPQHFTPERRGGGRSGGGGGRRGSRGAAGGCRREGPQRRGCGEGCGGAAESLSRRDGCPGLWSRTAATSAAAAAAVARTLPYYHQPPRQLVCAASRPGVGHRTSSGGGVGV